MVEEVVEAPVNILILATILEEGIHESEMVSLLVHKLGMRICCFSLLVLRPKEDIGSVEASDDGEDLIDAVELGRAQQDLGKLRLKGKFRHSFAFRSQISFIVQGAKVVEQLKSTH